MSETRDILRLAVPAFLTLVAEPLFVMADAALVGHVSTSALAGLGVASTVIVTLVGICVFLAYATTASVGRALGAGQRQQALGEGLDAVLLAAVLGVVGAGAVWWWGPLWCRWLGASGAVADAASTYVTISGLGLPAMLLLLAATGILRGFQDTTSPLWVAACGFALNFGLNLWFIFGLGWGVAGSAWGTVIAQWAMASALLMALGRIARVENFRYQPRWVGVWRQMVAGAPLLWRTIALRVSLLATMWLAALGGATVIAAHQVALTVFSTAAFALDALAIAAQAMTGYSLGSGDAVKARRAASTMARWGVRGGMALGVFIMVISPWAGMVFSPDPAVRHLVMWALLVVGAGQVLCGYVFVWDGVLIGAGDARWLAWAMTVAVVGYLTVVAALVAFAPRPAEVWIVTVWCGFLVFMGLRAAGLWWRSRSDAWVRLGAK